MNCPYVPRDGVSFNTGKGYNRFGAALGVIGPKPRVIPFPDPGANAFVVSHSVVVNCTVICTCLRGGVEGAFSLEDELLCPLGRDLFAVEHLVEGGLVLRVGRRRRRLPRPGEAGQALLTPAVFRLAFVLILRAVGGVASPIAKGP